MSISFMTLVAMLSGAIAIFCLVLSVTLLRRPIRRKQTFDKSFDRSNRSILTKLCWPLIAWMSAFFLPLMTWGLRQRLSQAIMQAGLSGWSSAHFFSMQIILGAGSACFVMLLFSMADISGSLNQLWLLLIVAMVMSVLPRFWLRAQRQHRYVQVERDLPFFLDMVNLALEAGMNLQTAVQLALDHLHPGPLKEEWWQTITEIRSGVPRTEAFRRMSQRIDLTCIRQMVNAFIQGESLGLSLGRSIAEFSRQQDQYRLLRSEKLALQAPIKMLFPLAFCIFPCTFLVLGFPVVAQLMGLNR